jgi:TRAP-type C4-dicarboxylate transport system permease small subunit
MLRTLLDGYYRLLRLALTLLMGALVVPVTLQVLSRFVDLVPRYIWTEELARFCFVWIIMIGAMIAVRDGTHFDLDVLPHGRSPRGEAAARLLVRLAMLVVALIFVWYGWQFVRFGWHQTSEIAELPMVWIFAAWPLAGITWLAFLGEGMAKDLRILRGGEA